MVCRRLLAADAEVEDPGAAVATTPACSLAPHDGAVLPALRRPTADPAEPPGCAEPRHVVKRTAESRCERAADGRRVRTARTGVVPSSSGLRIGFRQDPSVTERASSTGESNRKRLAANAGLR